MLGGQFFTVVNTQFFPHCFEGKEMAENTNELGLREAAKKYGVDPQAIRYWIKQGTVRVTRPSAGPGKSMSLDENSILDALARYRPHLGKNNQNQYQMQ